MKMDNMPRKISTRKTMKNTIRKLIFRGAPTLIIWLLPTALLHAESNTREFERIDRLALSVPEIAARNVPDLARHLTSNARNDREKARAIFRWLTANIEYDTVGFFRGDYGNLTPEGVLHSRKAVCSGYAQLFASLAEIAGLEVRKISGYSKGYGYSQGDSLPTQSNHAWNAVKIEGRWHLLDATWGAGYLNAQGRFVRQLENHYFLTDPQQFIYDHLPEETPWQLLERSVSPQEYRELVHMRPAAFRSGMKAKSHRKGTFAAKGEALLTFSASTSALFLATLETGEGRELPGLTMVQRRDETIEVHTHFPGPGTYRLKLFTKDRSESGHYSWALEYGIHAQSTFSGTAGFPEIYGTFTESAAYLVTPKTGTLPRGQQQDFRLEVPGAARVMVIVAGEWIPLRKEGNMFSGNVEIHGREVGVYAQFPGDEEFSGLLKYATR
jgi:hypothetical protein